MTSEEKSAAEVPYKKEDFVTLKELASKLEKVKDAEDASPIFEKNKCQDKTSSSQKSFEKLMSLETLSTISSPTKASVSGMGCNTPLAKLLQSFSPSAVQFMEQQGERYDNNIIPSLTSGLPLSMTTNDLFSASARSIMDSLFNNVVSDSKSNTCYYPGSMLTGAPQSAGCLPELESYLNCDSNDLEKQNTPNGYQEEVICSSEPSAWQPTVTSDNMLPPIMLSSYEDMALLQQQLVAANGMQQYVLPIFFQPFMMNENAKKKKRKVSKKLNHGNVTETQENEPVDQRVPNSHQPADWLSLQATDEELLNRCRVACVEGTVADKADTTIDSMKYLEEAAAKLLHTDGIPKPRQTASLSPGKHECDVCHRRFRRHYTLETHYRIHSGQRPFKCEYCGKAFKQSGTKLNHVRALHTKKKPFKCTYCGKCFSHKSSITVHTRIHTKEKPYQCEQCGRRFTDRATYTKHQAIHSGKKPYVCPICQRAFSQKSNLKRHILNVKH